ncbi:TPA: hypothetical protein GX533_00170 [Candidatus Dojkabacteria bacterium]|uniref:Uncharacterized protein n=1 Tax=Candidatus Dojkabacteria bacterium TaxID=2099670 RepID=A0A832R9M2_9BACT|nr:hypothetical protein [Candidatus Dojkabacteria bacterium]
MEEKNKKYNALGFVEALISIIIVGVSSVVLMRIAASALIEAVQNDKIDRITQFAVEGGNIVKELYEKQKELGFSGEGSLAYFPSPDSLKDISKCYVIVKSNDTQSQESQMFEFAKSVEFNTCTDPFVNGSVQNRGHCTMHYDKDVTNKQYPFFRLACMERISGIREKYISVKIVVGELNYDGKITKSGNVKDYVYQTIIPLEDE